MIYVKRKQNSGPHYMKNPSWCEQWKDLIKYCRAVETEHEKPVRIALVMWDGSMCRGQILSLGGEGDDRWIQVDSEKGLVVVHPMWVYVDWGGPDGRGFEEYAIEEFKVLDGQIDVESVVLT